MFRLRYYQHEARGAIRAAFQGTQSALCVMPTGTGKTELYLSIATEEAGRVLVIVHRDYLIESPIERLNAAGWSDVAIEKAHLRSEMGSRKAKIVFASIQSIGPESQAGRLATFNPDEFSLVIVDEGHRAVGDTYRRALRHFTANPKCRVLILTATPKRKDGVALGNVAQVVAYEMTPAQAAGEGWIVPPRFFRREVAGLDFSHVQMRGSDMDPDQMAAALTEEEPMHEVCASLAKDQGPTIVFCPSVAVAEVYAAAMNSRYRPNRSIAIHQASDDETRTMARLGLRDGLLDYVFNVDLLTEGYDVPRVERVVWAGGTSSLVRWTQGCGRGFRPDPSIARQLAGGREQSKDRRELIATSCKPFCSIVTYVASNCAHQICSGVDLLGGEMLPELREAAGQIEDMQAPQGGGSSPEEDAETARVFLDLRAALEERRKHLKAQATVVDHEFDGLGGEGGPTLKDDRKPRSVAESSAAAAASWGQGDPCTEKQAKWLRWKGAPAEAIEGCSKWRASVVRDLYEMGCPIARALAMGKRQALKVRDEMREKRAAAAESQGVAG